MYLLSFKLDTDRKTSSDHGRIIQEKTEIGKHKVRFSRRSDGPGCVFGRDPGAICLDTGEEIYV